MKALFMLVGLLATAAAILAAASGLKPAGLTEPFPEAIAAGAACGFAILGGLCFVAYAILVHASKMLEVEESGSKRD
jgi:hypothetical protein